MKKLEYGIEILISLAVLDFGLFFALGWYWSGFKWSPLGYENCGLEGIVFPIIVWPCFIFAELIRLGLLSRWKFPAYVWWIPLILCGIAAVPFVKCLTMGIYCILLMLLLPVMDFMALRKAVRRTDRKHDRLETERPDELSAKENREQKKIIDWLTYGLNMLAALSVFGLISVTIFSLTYQIICNTDPPVWAWSSPILLALFLIVFWGQYQYRILILKTPRPPHETRRNLLILAGCITIAFLLIFSLATYNKIERMEKEQQKLEQMKKIQQGKLK